MDLGIEPDAATPEQKEAYDIDHTGGARPYFCDSRSRSVQVPHPTARAARLEVT